MSRVRYYGNNPTTRSFGTYAERLECDPGSGWEEGIFVEENFSATTSNWHRTIYDVVVPDFHTRSRNGELFFNPLVDLVIDYKSQQAAFAGSWGTPACPDIYREGEVDLGSALASSPTYTSDFRSIFADMKDTEGISLASAWANVDESEMLALATLAEAPETVRWIQNILYRAIKLCREMLKLRKLRIKPRKRPKQKYRTASQTLDMYSDWWLEFRYAFRPLVFDMIGALKALEKSIAEKTRHTARGYSSDSQTDSLSGTIQLTGYETFDYTGTRVRTKSSRSGVLYSIDDNINGITSVWGLDQPLEAIWDLTPFSFIVDWFFNVGDIIAGWSANPSLRPLGSWCTTTYTYTEKVSATGVNHLTSTSGWTDFGYDPEVTAPGSAQRSWSAKVRVIEPARPIFPSLNLNLDLGKITDLAAIGRNLFRMLA